MMELSVNIDISWKPLIISANTSISNNWLSSKYVSGILKVTLHKCTTKSKHLRKNEKDAKISLAKQLQQLLWNVPKDAVLRFLEKHAWRRGILPGAQLAAWNVTKEKLHQIYFLATYLKLLATSTLPVGRLESAVSWATTSTAR